VRILDVLKPWYVFRDAVTGRYVSRLYALAHPSTTVRQRVRRKAKD
jgi:hypothetical protein